MTAQELIDRLRALDLDPGQIHELVTRIQAEGLTDKLELEALALLEDARDQVEAEEDALGELADTLDDLANQSEVIDATTAEKIDRITEEVSSELDAQTRPAPVVPAEPTAMPVDGSNSLPPIPTATLAPAPLTTIAPQAEPLDQSSSPAPIAAPAASPEPTLEPQPVSAPTPAETNTADDEVDWLTLLDDLNGQVAAQEAAAAQPEQTSVAAPPSVPAMPVASPQLSVNPSPLTAAAIPTSPVVGQPQPVTPVEAPPTAVAPVSPAQPAIINVRVDAQSSAPTPPSTPIAN